MGVFEDPLKDHPLGFGGRGEERETAFGANDYQSPLISRHFLWNQRCAQRTPSFLLSPPPRHAWAVACMGGLLPRPAMSSVSTNRGCLEGLGPLAVGPAMHLCQKGPLRCSEKRSDRIGQIGPIYASAVGCGEREKSCQVL